MKYPIGTNKVYKSETSYSNRGMNLEDDINQSNIYYLNNDIAVIHKKPTPITIVDVYYPSRNKAIIKEAYFKSPSTTDYNGLYKGRHIDFEAKETSKNSFSLNNIHPHQIKHLENIIKHNGIGFIIVRFTKLNITYCLSANKLLEFIQNSTNKSIPLKYFEENGFVIKEGYSPRLDYLKIVDILWRNYEKEN